MGSQSFFVLSLSTCMFNLNYLYIIIANLDIFMGLIPCRFAVCGFGPEATTAAAAIAASHRSNIALVYNLHEF